MAFIGDSNNIAVTSNRSLGEGRDRITVYDAVTAREIKKLPLPDCTGVYGSTFSHSVPRGVLFGRRRDENTIADGLSVLDLESGRWGELSKTMPCGMIVDPFRPWVATLEGSSPRKARRVAVFDWQTGAMLFSYPLREGEVLSDWPFFLVKQDRIVVPLMPATVEDENSGERSARGWLEVWSLGIAPELDHKALGIEGAHSAGLFSHSLNDRLLFDSPLNFVTKNDEPSVSVYDLNERRLVAANASLKGITLTRGSGRVPPTISRDGKAVLRNKQDDRQVGYGWADHGSALIEFESGKVLWQSGWAETVESVPWVPYPDRFRVIEEWDRYWETKLPNWKYQTRAWRSLRDGRLLFRTTHETEFEPRHCNAAMSLFVSDKGSVHRLPLPANWPLLALCQAVLGLPLVLLWTTLRWRRNRRMRVGRGPHNSPW